MPRPHLPPILREMQALRALGVRKLCLQALLVGGISGGVIGAFRLSYTHISESLAGYAAAAPAGPLTMAIVFGAVLLLAVGGWALLRFEPLIGGSGIPQVELAIEGRLPMPWRRILWAKFAGTMLSLTGGLSVGREGPCIQMGAAVGCWVGRIWHEERPEHLPRYLIGGSVAGMTAAFGAPFAGLLFAFEEVKAVISAPLALFTGLAAGAAYLVIEAVFDFGLVFPLRKLALLEFGQWWIPVAAGLLTGCLGALYNGLLMFLVNTADRFAPPVSLKRILPVFLLSGVLLHICPWVLSGFGLEVPALEETSLAFGTLAALLAVKMLFSCVSFASGVAGGLLMPILLAGGIAGASLAPPLLGASLIRPDQAGCLLALGMAGLFSSTARAPLTGTALILEMTGGWRLAPALLAVSLISSWTAGRLHSEPIYDSLKRRIRDLERQFSL
ncbi:MAG: chloride channel protein [Desulfovibrio sp.]|jgi:H+/Cl- antiporter ClcA|nr:chloride channel protein [Desulfovibrio sp.]